MTEMKRFMPKQLTIGDAAVDGLLNGVLAGIVMAAFFAFAGLLTGDSPLSVLGRFDPSGRSQPLTGVLLHRAVAGVYGTLFRIIWRQIARRPHQNAVVFLIGLIYGTALLIFAEIVILPGTTSPLQATPLWDFALGHLVYGLTLGLLFRRARET